MLLFPLFIDMDTLQKFKKNHRTHSTEKEGPDLWHRRQDSLQDIEVEVDPINRAALKHFGIPYLFPFQRLVISNILEAAGFFGSSDEEIGGATEESKTPPSEASLEIIDPPVRRQLAILPTGAGKSLCFMLPGVLLPHLTLLIFPLLSLMSDQLRRLEEQGIPAAQLSGGQCKNDRENIWRRAEADELKFLLSNPETLIQPHNLEHLRELSFDHVVIDEAHTLPDWGLQFREALLRVPEIIDACRPKMLSAFTATASDKIESQLQELFSGAGGQRSKTSPYSTGTPAGPPIEASTEEHTLEPLHVIRANPDRPNISYHVIESLCKFHDLRRLLDPEYRYALPRPALVFCATRMQAQRCAFQLRRWLEERDIYFYHAGLDRKEKKRVQKWFFDSEEGILTATTAFGMGVDKKNVRTVVHYNVSRSVEAFLQESGRGGRDTEPAFSVVLYDAHDSAAAQEGRDSRYLKLLGSLTNRNRCVRESLMEAMGSPPVACSGCDICLKSRPRVPAGYREIMNFFHVYPRRFDSSGAAKILCGVESIRSLRRGYRHMYGYGALSNWSVEEVESALFCLEKAGELKKTRRGFWRGCIRPVRHRTLKSKSD